MCVLVQVETRTALAEIEAIAAVEGVDGIFIGPSDLAADMGHLADATPPGGAGGDRRGVRPHPGGRQGRGHADR